MFGPCPTSRAAENYSVHPLIWKSIENNYMLVNLIFHCMVLKLANGIETGVQHSSCPTDFLFDLNGTPAPSIEDGFDHAKFACLATTNEGGINHSLRAIGSMNKMPFISSPEMNPSPSSKESQSKGTTGSNIPRLHVDRVRSSQQKQPTVSQTRKLHEKIQRYPWSSAPSDILASQAIRPCDPRVNCVEHVRDFDLNKIPSEEFQATAEQDKDPLFTGTHREGAGAYINSAFEQEQGRLKKASPASKISRVNDSNAVTEGEVREGSQPLELYDREKSIENKSTSESKTESSFEPYRRKQKWATASPRSALVSSGSKAVETTFVPQATLTYFQELREKLLLECKCPGLHDDNARTLSVQADKLTSMKQLTLTDREKKPKKKETVYTNYARKANYMGSQEAHKLELDGEIEDFIGTLRLGKRTKWIRSSIYMLLYDVKVVCAAFPEIVRKDVRDYQIEAWNLIKLQAWGEFLGGGIRKNVACKAQIREITPEQLDAIMRHAAQSILQKDSAKRRLATSRMLLQAWLARFCPILYENAKDSKKPVLQNRFINILNAFQQFPEILEDTITAGK